MDRIEREDESWFGVGIAAPEGSFFFFFGSDRIGQPPISVRGNALLPVLAPI